MFPVGPDKKPLIKDWQRRTTTDLKQLERWQAKWPEAMPAIPTGSRSGVVVLDVDKKNGKDGFKALAEMGFDVEALSPVQIETPSGGRHIYFRWEEGMGNSAKGLPPGLDIRGEGGLVVAPGAVNGVGVYRALSGTLTIGDVLMPEALKPHKRRSEPGDGDPTGLPFDVIVSALDACPNDGDEYASRDAWLAIGMALHCETGGSEEGREAWHAWSGRWQGFDADDTDHAWESFKADKGVTGWHIIHEAERHGWRDATVTQMLWLDDLDHVIWPEEEAEIAALVGGDVPAEATGLTFLSPAECAALPARPYVVKGLLAEHDVAAIVGAPGAGKSLLAPRLCYAVAQGETAFGRRVRQGGVLYIAAEDHGGLALRIAALRAEHGEAEHLHLVGGVSDLLSKSGQLAELRATVKARRPSLIVIDTLAVAFPGLEENDAKAMGQVVKAARSLTTWGAAVVLIHHDTKAGDGLPRGHSILNGALDVSLHLKRDGDVVTGSLTKNRNGSTEERLAFTIGERPVGIDADGEPRKTAICEEVEAGKMCTSGPRLTPSAAAALDVLRQLSGGTKSILESEWRHACVEGRQVSGADNADSRRKAFKRAVELLTRNHVLTFADGKFTEIRQQGEDFTDDLPEV